MFDKEMKVFYKKNLESFVSAVFSKVKLLSRK